MKRFALVVGAALAVACLPPDWGANAILEPARRPLVETPALPHEAFAFESDGVTLRGWLFRGPAPRKGLIVYLHGIGDNRRGGGPLAERFVPQGWDVLAYDGRAHGESGGEVCTYGFHEKRDLVRALDHAGDGRVVLFGSSLGAAVALQAAPLDPRIRGVIAEAPFRPRDAARAQPPHRSGAHGTQAPAGRSGRRARRCAGGCFRLARDRGLAGGAALV